MVDATCDEATFTEHHRTYPLAAPVRRQASPLRPLTGEELVHIEGSFSFEHDVDGAAELLGKDGQRLGLAVLVHESLMEFLAVGIGSQEQACGLAEGPAKMDVADFAARSAIAFAGRLLGAFDQSGIGEEVADLLEARNSVDFIEYDESEDLADAWHGVQQVQGIRVVRLGAAHDVGLELGELLVVDIDERDIERDAFAYAGVGEALSQVDSVGLAGDFLAEGLEIVLAVGVLDVGEQLGTLVDQMVAPAQQVTGGAHFGWIGIGLCESTAAQQDSNFV